MADSLAFLESIGDNGLSAPPPISPPSGIPRFDALDAEVGRPEWFDASRPVADRARSVIQTNVAAGADFANAARQLRAVGVAEPERVEGQFKLEAARKRASTEEIPWAVAIGRHVPGAGTAGKILLEREYGLASRRIAEGKGREKGQDGAAYDDYDLVAQYERMQQIDRSRSLAGTVGQTVASIPALVAETAAGGALFRGAKIAARGAEAVGAADRAFAAAQAGRGFLGRKAAQLPGVAGATAFSPIFYGEEAQRNLNEAAARGKTELLDQARALGAAFTYGVAQNAVVGQLLRPAAGAFVPTAAKKTALGMLEQQAVDAVAGFADIKTGYGAFGDILRGKTDEGLKQAVGQIVMFGAFAGLHGKPADAKRVLAEQAAKLDRMAAEGVPPAEAAARVVADLPRPAGAPPEGGATGNVSGRVPEKTLESGVSADPLAHWSDRDVWDAAVALTGLKSKGKIDRRKAMDALERANVPADLLAQFTKASNVPPAEQRYARPPEPAQPEPTPETPQEAPGIEPEAVRPPEPADTPERPPTPAQERRTDLERRRLVAEMSPEELRKELLTSQVVDLPNRRAFDEAGPANAVGMSDADGLKAFNDTFGYAAGDALLNAKAEALKAAGVDAYHEKGDEFLYRAGSPEELRTKLERARELLRDATIEVTLKDGTVKRYKGADFSYGTGADLGVAEKGLKAHKSEREARGERARGELRGITEVGPGAGGVGQGGADQGRAGPPEAQGQAVAAPAGPGAYVSPGESPAERGGLSRGAPYRPGEEIPGGRRVTAVPRGLVREEARRIAALAADDVTAQERAAERRLNETPYEKLPAKVREKSDALIDRLVREGGADAERLRTLARIAYTSRGRDGKNAVRELHELWEERLRKYEPTPEELADAEAELALAERENDEANAIVAEAERLGQEALRRVRGRAAQTAAAAAHAPAPRPEDAGGAARPAGAGAGEVPRADAGAGRGADQPAAAGGGEAAGDRVAAVKAARKRVADIQKQLTPLADRLNAGKQRKGDEARYDALTEQVKAALADQRAAEAALARQTGVGYVVVSRRPGEPPEVVSRHTSLAEANRRAGGEAAGRFHDTSYLETRRPTPDEFGGPGRAFHAEGGGRALSVEREGGNLPAPPPSGESQVGGIPTRPGAGGPLGVRQANPQGEFALAREKVTQERELRGRDAVEAAVRRSNPAGWANATAEVARNPRAGYELVDRLEADPQSVRPDADVPLLLLHRVALSNAHDAATAEYNQRAGQFAFQGGEMRRVATEAELEPLRRRAEDLALDRDRLDRVTAAVGTQLGRGLQYFRQLAREDYSLGGMLAAARFAKGGQDLTPAEATEVVKAHREVAKADKALGEAEGGNVTSRDADLADLRIAVKRARRGWADTIANLKATQQTRAQKVIAGTREGLNASRSLVTALDFSAVLRQGGFLSLAHPVRAARALPDMFRAFASRRDFDRQQDALDQRPNAELYRRSGLYLADIDGQPSAREEAFVSRLGGRIPGVRASERAYVGFLNRLRADVFDSMVAGLSRGGRPTTAEAKVVANFVNVATGRGSLNTPVGSLEGSATTLAAIFFSPRYVASRFQLLAGQPLYSGSAATRKLVAQEYARFAAGFGVFVGLALAADDKARFTLDPRSSDFGKIRMGNTRIDLLTGLGQTIVAPYRVISGEKKDSSGRVVDLRGPRVPYRGDTTLDVGANFVRGKLAPVPGVVGDVLVGKSVTGEKATARREAGQLLVPMAGREVVEALQDQGVPRGAVAGLLGVFGAGTQTFTPGRK